MITKANAIEISRNYFNLNESVLASVWKVINLRNLDENYFLVIFGTESASVAVATVGCKIGNIKASAQLSGTSHHLNISKRRALELTGYNKNAQIEMVWEPCSLSYSQLYPIWKVSNSQGIYYVNQEGIISDKLDNLKMG
jgi:hypothetical protein